MTIHVVLAESGDGEKEDITCQSNQEEDANQQGETEEKMGNTDLEDSAASWYVEFLLCFDLLIQL